ncbi:uncharacterized protein LOC111717719 [Eurytemora carolleeae]|uniref:uncharacterized protein LOC111717719 n=1 Tax=Eurytemora carolleeae TaxID=1294199 RepID=UPI000C7900C8|nr:uncharacterized protein LOC111717719 [Eurytemora carolleeae]|eukprot:XP_023348965.1 uncharacterized protein LOC111717719 [Eurytemora affinis]
MALTAIIYKSSTRELELLDQRLLPTKTDFVVCKNSTEVAEAIRGMVVRGAPAIGITAAYGLALAELGGENIQEAYERLLASRPTAVNLKWALDKVLAAADKVKASQELHEEDVEINKLLGENGANLLEGGVLTICNTGALATGGHGTALGMVRSALEKGRKVHVYACETRPYNQGARLTTWECVQDNIPCTLITDSMAGFLMKQGKVQAVIAGCDRVARNGDTANKIGTYSLAVLANYHKIPFYIGMPMSTLDMNCPSGDNIPIEERPPGELFSALPSVGVWNPAFDVTPANLITGWVSEEGVWTKDKFWI